MLYDELIKIRSRNKIPFHMPGSKGGLAVPEEYKDRIWDLDFTELGETDNLANPVGIIKSAQDKAAEIYGVKNSFFLVNGSSGGILAALRYLYECGCKKVIFDRNCHLSVINGIRLSGLKPVFIMPEFMEEWGITGEINLRKLEMLIAENPEAGAVFVTSPNYCGISSDIERIYEICKKNNKLLCVDAAHGAHFNFSRRFKSAAGHCDICIMSIHKTMPAPTQTAILHTSEKIDGMQMRRCVNMFQTTSPSYIFMSYIDFAIRFMNENGEKIYDGLYSEVSWLGNILNNNMLTAENKDFSRIVIKGGFKLAEYLYNNYDTAVEAADVNNIICIAGLGNTHEHFLKLAEGVTEFYKKYGEGKNKSVKPYFEVPEISPKDFSGYERKAVKINEAVGQVAAESIVPYPPGVPLIIEGETVTKEAVAALEGILCAGAEVNGLANNGLMYIFNKNLRKKTL